MKSQIIDDTIYFPGIINSATLGGRKFGYNDIKSGVMLKLADMNLDPNRFYGGRCDILGLVPEYGFYACIEMEPKEVIGFYVSDPEKVTPRGQELIRAFYADREVSFLPKSERVMTKEERERRKELKLRAMEMSIETGLLDSYSADELEELIKQASLPRADKPGGIPEPNYVGPVDPNPTHFADPDQGRPPKILKGRMNPRKAQ